MIPKVSKGIKTESEKCRFLGKYADFDGGSIPVISFEKALFFKAFFCSRKDLVTLKCESSFLNLSLARIKKNS